MPRPTVLVVEHDVECPPALVGTWLTERGCELDVRRPYAGDALPEPAELTSYAALLVLGGPMGAHDDELHAWLAPAKDLVREAARNGVPTLGICLGHQLIAAALGGRVEPNPRGQQVGLLDVGWTPAAAGDPLMGPLSSPRRGVHWNDDVVTQLPAGAVVLAVAEHGEAQVVRYGPRMWGVQLHPEVDVTILQPWAESDRGSHETRGIDTDALLRDIDDARVELDEAWRPLAGAFAALLTGAEPVAR